MLRSIRHARDELVLQGTITPKKSRANLSSDDMDVDCLCDLFQSKASITPKNRSSAKARSIPNAPFGYATEGGEEVDSVKENLGDALKIMSKTNFKSTRFCEGTKPAAATPVRRSRRRRS